MYRYGAATCWIAFVLLFRPSVVSGKEPFGVPYTAGGTTAMPNASLSVARHASEIDGIVAGKEFRVLQVGKYVTSGVVPSIDFTTSFGPTATSPGPRRSKQTLL